MYFRTNVVRLLRIVFIVGKNSAGFAIDSAFARFPRLAAHFRVKRIYPPERLRQTIESLGGCFLKFGQMLALQPDILSLEYCNALFNLMDRVQPFPFEQVEATFLEELGKRPAELFESFEVKPLATASIGQVHVGWLNGRKWAVKVQRPDVRADFAGDIRLMAGTIRLIRALRLQSLHWMIEPMSEFIAWTRDELDFRREARYTDQLRANAVGNPHERVPEVYWDYVTPRTLVIEFLEGCTVLDYLRALESGNESLIEKLESKGFDSHAVASNIIDNFLGDVHRHGMFHADLHPANLMILEGNVVGYIDFGITGTISTYSRQKLVALTLAYTRGDLAGMCEPFFLVSAMDNESCASRFRQGLARASETWYENEGKERRLRKNFTLVMLDMLVLSRESGVWPERDVIKYIRSSIAIDGLITRFAPTFDVGEHLGSVCDRYLKWQVRHSLLTSENIASWAEANRNIFGTGAVRAAKMIHNLARTGNMDAAAPGARHVDSGVPNSKTLMLGGYMLVLSVLITMTPRQGHFGTNIFTAEIAVFACTAFMLIRTTLKLRKEN